VSDPRKHHYVPACYLKQWANNSHDRRLCEHKLIPGGYGVNPRRTSPNGTGYQIDLYRVDGVPDDVAQDLEKRYMHLVDTDGLNLEQQPKEARCILPEAGRIRARRELGGLPPRDWATHFFLRLGAADRTKLSTCCSTGASSKKAAG
jgi:hypothetical protein